MTYTELQLQVGIVISFFLGWVTMFIIGSGFHGGK